MKRPDAPQSPSRPRLVPPLLGLLLALVAGCQAPPSVPEPPTWPLRPDADEDNGGTLPVDVRHLALDLTLDFQGRRVYGTATSWVRALRDGTRHVVLHGVGLDLSEVTDASGRSLDFVVDEPRIVVELAAPLARGEEEQVRVRYAATPTRGMHFRDATRFTPEFSPLVFTHGQPDGNRHWLPIWDHPNDRTTVEMRVRADLGMEVRANGELQDVIAHGPDERTFVWRIGTPIPTYLIALAAGRFESYADQAGTVPLGYVVAGGTGEERARATFSETPEMLRFFEQYLDEPFPFERYDQVAVADFVTGGMENASLTFVTDEIVTDPDERLDLDGEPRILVAHELAHQWFGDLVTCWGWSELWLNEAFASWMELAWVGQVEGEDARRLWFERYRDWYLADGEDTRLPLCVEWRVQGCSDHRSHHVYTKGPWVVEMLARQLGEADFQRVLRRWMDEHRGGLVTRQDLVRTIFDETGVDVTRQLEQWVEGGGHPVLRVRHEVRLARSRLHLFVDQVQETDHLVPLFDLEVPVEVRTEDGKVLRQVLRVNEQSQEFVLPLSDELVDVVIDPDCDLLLVLEQDKPGSMWREQAGDASTPAKQWRALPGLRAAADEDLQAGRRILEVLRASPQPLLRQRAARLADFEDPLALDQLVTAICEDPDARVRREAAHTLLQLQARERLEPDDPRMVRLLDHLAQEPSPATRAKLEQVLELRP